MADETNPTERRRWNDERWTSFWPRRERFTDTVTPSLLDTLALEPGERVLDVGSGGGRTTVLAARAVGPQGAAVGADISGPLVELARQRARDAALENVTFHVVDMQHDDVPGGPFDVALSQFGVMFFDEPVTAFANIARHLRPGGRLVFACWQAPERNPWVVAVAIGRFLPVLPPPAVGKAPTGPFALSDAERTTEILRAAGFTDVRHTPIDMTIDVPEVAIIDEDQLVSMGVAEADMPAARDAIEELMARFRVDEDVSRFPIAFQIFEARAT